MKDKKATSDAGSARPEISLFHAALREWFVSVFPAPTRPQALGWPAIARRFYVDSCADRDGQDAGGVSLVR